MSFLEVVFRSEEPEPRNPESDSQEPLSILVVEDDPMIASLMVTMFLVHHVRTAATVEDARTFLEKAMQEGKPIDWIITDRGLGSQKDGGFEVAERIQANKQALGSPFVTMFTGSADDVQRENPGTTLQERGIDDLVSKPFRPREFIAKVPHVRQVVREARSKIG